MPDISIQDAIKHVDERDLVEARYNRHKARQRASERLDEASIANYRAAARWLSGWCGETPLILEATRWRESRRPVPEDEPCPVLVDRDLRFGQAAGCRLFIE